MDNLIFMRALQDDFEFLFDSLKVIFTKSWKLSSRTYSCGYSSGFSPDSLLIRLETKISMQR